MSRSLIQTANQSQQTVALNSIISPGSVQRRFGCDCRLSGNGIEVEGAGYYTVTASITATPTAIGNVTVVMNENGSAHPGAMATGSVAAEGDSTNLSIVTTVRKGCCCDTGASNLTFVLTEWAGIINNISIRVEKA